MVWYHRGNRDKVVNGIEIVKKMVKSDNLNVDCSDNGNFVV